MFFLYPLRRVNCPRCGICVETVPWATGKQGLTDTYVWFLATWAKRLSWTEVARAFHTSWDTVFRSVAMAVAWGRARRNLGGVSAIGIDEVQWQRGHKYLTVVYQINDHWPPALLSLARKRAQRHFYVRLNSGIVCNESHASIHIKKQRNF